MALLAGTPVRIIYALHLPAIKTERKASANTTEPSADPQHSVLGGLFYVTPKDPRAFVPQPPHTGIGMTINVATPGGRLALIGLLLLVVASLALAFLL